MTTNELRILSIIWDWGGEASLNMVAREAGISINYAQLLCENLGRGDFIDFLHSKLCKIKSKGKLAMVGRLGQNPKRIAIPGGKSKFGLGKDKRGRIILNYG